MHCCIHLTVRQVSINSYSRKAHFTCLLATMTIGTLLSRSSPSTLCSSLKDSGRRFSSAESTTNISIHVSCMKLDQYVRIACEPPTIEYTVTPPAVDYSLAVFSGSLLCHSNCQFLCCCIV